MITGEIKSQIDKIWESFWTGGVSNPLTVIEQFTYLLFIRRLDETQIMEEKKANMIKKPVSNVIFTPTQQELRWRIEIPKEMSMNTFYLRLLLLEQMDNLEHQDILLE